MDWNQLVGALGAAAGIGSFVLEASSRARKSEDDAAGSGDHAGPAVSNWGYGGAITLLVCSVLFLVGQQLENDGEDEAATFIGWALFLAFLTAAAGGITWFLAVMYRHRAPGEAPAWRSRGRRLSERGRIIGAVLVLFGLVLFVLVSAFYASADF